MDKYELHQKLLNNALCRLCLNGKSEEIIQINESNSENHLKPAELIEKFNLVEFNENVTLNTICAPCCMILETFYNLHLVAISSQDKILKILREFESDLKAEKQRSDEEVVIEFLNIEQALESTDENEAIDLYQGSALSNEDENFDFECNFCSKTYKKKAHLERHLRKLHQDGVVRSTRKIKTEECALCGTQFTTQSEFDDHMEKIVCVPEISPECRICGAEFSNVSKLQDHLSSNHSRYSKRFTCPICFKVFSSGSNRNSHLQSHNPQNSVTCTVCHQGFKSVLYLRKHEKAIHTKVENTCHLCGRKFDTQQKFDYHLKSHESEKRYKCTYSGCNKSFMQHHHLENHKTTHSSISKYLCFKCGREFKLECNLKAHLKIHDSNIEKTFKCTFPNCEETFKERSTLRYHQRIHDKDSQSRKCSECGKKFALLSTLKAHFQNHFRDPNNRPFKCNQPECNQSYYQKRSLTYHQSSAHGIGKCIARKKSALNFVCDYCKKSFKLQSLLKRHILTHVEEEQQIRKHKCDKCEASFKRHEHLKLHINSVHLKNKPYKCDHPGCDKRFAQIGDRNVHMKVHDDHKPHVCSICQKAFRLAKGLRAHEKTHDEYAKKTVELPDVISNQNEPEIVYETVQPNSHIVFLLTPIQ